MTPIMQTLSNTLGHWLMPCKQNPINATVLGQSQGLHRTQAPHLATCALMLAFIAAFILGSFDHSVILALASTQVAPLPVVLALVGAFLFILFMALVLLIESKGTRITVACIGLFALASTAEIGAMLHGTVLGYLILAILGTVSLNALMLALNHDQPDEHLALVAALIAAGACASFDFFIAHKVFVFNNTPMQHILNGLALALPILICGLVAATAVSRWNHEQIIFGSTLTRCAIPAIACALFVCGLALALLLLSALRFFIRDK